MAYYPRLKDLREDHDLTQAKVAELLFITQQQYSLYEKGYRDIPTTALVTLANLYNTSVDYILGRTDSK
ncbi:MAG: helix-turn-helix transcriptional regulator [Clostridia bacterium]|nr:helix-turn-helix transcriptional regulator [Clostridia bacterium]